ncbi:hypothetical protein Nepgr_025506 [Nepenthes gracilis]|uniref:Uncharacterized protein n=1 Tax=Nepenthes gracilis TaxID=150966 RepID=A0AAD3T6F5_NEPGR|nr:hypothetical protein Nepgr_025506 [Nepenthes gracilis]
MTTAEQTANPKSIDSALWFDSFRDLFAELENVPFSSDPPSSLVDMLKENHAWFLDNINLFKPPNQKSKEALDSERIKVGAHEFSIKHELRDLALKLSSTVCLDEVQSYILVERSTKHNTVLVNGINQGSLHEMVLQYYIERQCLLKCARQLFIHALHLESGPKIGKAIADEVLKLISDGLESKLISTLNRLLLSCHPDQMDVDLFILWAEETLIEDNLVLDILFLMYYESFSTCSADTWRKLCLLYKGTISGSFNFGKLRVSDEAVKSSYHAKVQILLILVETLDLESLLQMIHDEVPFREGSILFSLSSIQEMDAVISSFDVFEMKEVGPLFLLWAVFLCLIISLPGKEDDSQLMEIDHVGYVHQAFEADSLSYFLGVLRSDLVKDSDGPVAGYRSILRTFISSFIASYEINVQMEDGTLKLILTLLGEIYRGEESLCIQFWDKDSIVDGPIRCLLCDLEGEFPYRTTELIHLLSALCEGSWPAECVYKFLDKSVGITSLFEINSDNLVDDVSQTVETRQPLHVPGVEGLMIPGKTRGRVLRMIGDGTALVRWEYAQSGVFVLLLRLSQELDLDGNEEILLVLDLFSRLASFNKAVCYALMNIDRTHYIPASYSHAQTHTKIWIDVVEILCNLVRYLSSNCSNVLAISMGISILAKMLKCSPSHFCMVLMKLTTFDLAIRTSIFGVCSNGLPSSSWLLSGRLAKMLLIDCEQNTSCPLTISVLDFTVQLLEAGVENDFVFALVVFCLQYVFVNHEYWKYKVKQDRWMVTLKVLGVLKTSIMAIPYLDKFGGTIQDIILSDSSIHNLFFRFICTTSQTLEGLYVSRLYNFREIEGLQRAVCSVLDILLIIVSTFSKDDFSGLPVLFQAMLSPTTKPVPVVAALTSLMSYFRCPALQVSAARLLSMLCIISYYSEPLLIGNSSFGLEGQQLVQHRHSIEKIICEQSIRNEDLFVATVKLLTSAAHCQPAFLDAIFAAEAITNFQKTDSVVKDLTNEFSFRPLTSENARLLVDMVLVYVHRSENLLQSNPRVLLSILDFLKALWQGAAQYMDILKTITKSKKFWERMSESISTITHMKAPAPQNLTEAEAQNFAYKYRCQSAALDILALDMFLQKKLLHGEILAEQADESSKESLGGFIKSLKPESSNLQHHKDIFSSWSKSSVLSELLKSAASCIYDVDIHRKAKIAFSLFSVHVMAKLTSGDAGSLSVSLIEKLNSLSSKLINLPAFFELSTQYSQHGYSEGTELRNLIYSDLYYHLQGELEGRNIDTGPFKELSQSLIDSNILQIYEKKHADDILVEANDIYLFDLVRLRKDMGLDMWYYSEWNASKEIAETMLLHLQKVTSMLLLVGSRLSTLRALILILTLNESTEEKNTTASNIPKDLILSCIGHVCQELRASVDLLVANSDVPEGVLNILSAQSELLLCLVKNVNGSMSLDVCKLVLQTCGFGLKTMSESRSLLRKVKLTMKLLLLILILAVEYSCDHASWTRKTNTVFGEVSNTCLSILPILCSSLEISDHYILSVTAIDLILRSSLSPSTWFPIIQQHLQLQHVIVKLHENQSFDSIPEILKFLLTLAQVKGGADMLLASGFLPSLKVLFSNIFDGIFYLSGNSPSIDKIEKSQYIWGLGLAVLTSVICYLGENSLSAEVVDNMITYFFSEKAYLIAYHLSAPDFPSGDHDKKRAQAPRRETSLSSLRATEHTLMLICVLAKHRNSWVKAMREIDSELRERSIHLLAFISRGSQCLGDSPTHTVPFICLPICKEEFDWFKKPGFVNSRNGWFALARLGCLSGKNLSSESVKKAAIVVKDRLTTNAETGTPTLFSDTVAVQIYRIAFLLLKFLCVEADNAARRAEELGFVDLSHFPELPMPNILHGLQDQSMAIVAELCEANKLIDIREETQGVCLLLLEVAEMALHLELCVSQICGIRPVMGRVEDFSKEVKSLIRATEAHGFLKPSIKHLKRIASAIYPDLLHNEGFS